MDKKDYLIIAICVLCMIWGMQHFAPKAPPPDQGLYSDETPTPGEMTPTQPGDTTTMGTAKPGDTVKPQPPTPTPVNQLAADFSGLKAQQPITLKAGDTTTYVVAPESGGLDSVTLEGMDITVGHPDEPMYAVQPEKGKWTFSHAKIVKQDDHQVTIARQVVGMPLVVEQTWTLTDDKPYQFTYDLRLKNLSDATLAVPQLKLQTGAMEDLGTPRGFMGSGGYDQAFDLRATGKKSPKMYTLASIRKLKPDDLAEMADKQVDWVAVQNKYFATITSQTDEQPMTGVHPVTDPVLTMAIVPSKEEGTWRGEVYRLNKKEPSLTVTLSSSDPDVVSVAPSAVIPAGSSSATFEVTVKNASAATADNPVRLQGAAKGMARGMAVFPPKPLSVTGVHVMEDLLVGYVAVNPDQLSPHGSQSWSYSVYLGPKQFEQLEALGDNKASLMRFDLFLFFHLKIFESISRLVLWGITSFHSIFHSYGLAIMMITLILRLLFWPITHRSTVMSRKMQQIAPIAKELREKYGSDPQKLHQKTMELYREHKINPLSGCLPALLQIPAFFALYNVLRGAIELRHASFLWAYDLSLPDTVGFLAGIPINPLAIIMAVTMVVNMKFVPQGAGDPSQQRMMMIMSLSFVVFLYAMPSGLTLYYATNQILNIVQYRITHKMMDRTVAPVPAKA